MVLDLPAAARCSLRRVLASRFIVLILWDHAAVSGINVTKPRTATGRIT